MAIQETTLMTKRTRYEMLRSRIVKERHLQGASEKEIERAVRSELERLRKLRTENDGNEIRERDGW